MLSSIGDSQDIVPKFGMERVSEDGDKGLIISWKIKIHYDL